MKPIVVAAMLLFAPVAHAAEVTGYLQGEGNWFVDEPLDPRQERSSGSVAAQVELFHEFSRDDTLLVTLFGRADSADERRTHADLREFAYTHVGDGWEVKLGVSKVFWGTTEFSHLVDVINQTDGVESPDGEEKLGQPMALLSIPSDIGTVNVFVLPGFRERTYPGEKGRLRFPLVVDVDNARYESTDGKNHVDYALRYTHTIGDWDIGLSYFNGTSRDPALLYSPTAGASVLIPYYALMTQYGVDLSVIAGDAILKLEAIQRETEQESYQAADVGFEYTFYGVFDSAADVGAIVEYLYDSRGDEAMTPYNHDVTIGARLAFNDVDSSDLLVGLIQDTQTAARSVVVEGSTRFGEGVRVSLEGAAFLDAPDDDPLYGLRNDSYLKAEANFYF